MPQDGTLLCSKGIIKGDRSNFRLISDKNLFYQLFVTNLLKILKTFHFVQRCTHLQCQWNVLFYYFPDIIIPKIWLPWKLEFIKGSPKSGTYGNIMTYGNDQFKQNDNIMV